MRHFKKEDPKVIKKIGLYGSKEDKKEREKNLEEILFPLKRSPSFYHLNNNSLAGEILACDIILIISSEEASKLKEKVLELGIPFLCHKNFCLESPDSVSWHRVKEEKEIFDLFKKILLDEGPLLSYLGNLTRNLHLLLQKEKRREKPHFTHIINPPPRRLDSDLYGALPLVSESLRTAKNVYGSTLVKQVQCNYEGEDPQIFKEMTQTDFLERSVLDLGSFEEKRKLPLIKDILDRAYSLSKEGEYLVYTNADIILLPHFYSRIAELIQEGYDGLVVNRRTLSKEFLLKENLNGIYSEIGKPHPGFDCFIFRRELLDKFDLGNNCVGAHLACRSFFYNLFTYCKKFTVLKEEHLTCHIGDDNNSKQIKQLDYIRHNTFESLGVLQRLHQKHNIYDKLNLKETKENLGQNILTFNFGPGKFIQKNWKNERIIQKNALERPLLVHSHSNEEASFLMNHLEKSKSNLLLKGKLRSHFKDLIQDKKSFLEKSEKLMTHFTSKNWKNFYEMIKRTEEKRESFDKTLKWHQEKYRNHSESGGLKSHSYRFDLTHSQKKDSCSLEFLIERIQSLVLEEGSKCLVHVIYKKDLTGILREKLPEFYHISLFKNEAAHLSVNPSQLSHDLFYQKRLAFELLCLNKTVNFSEDTSH